MEGMDMETGLRSDSEYRDLRTMMSKKPIEFITAFPPSACPIEIRSCAVHSTRAEAPEITRFRGDAKGVSTELYGTAPMRLPGEGTLMFPDMSTDLRIGQQTSSRSKSEFVDTPETIRSADFFRPELATSFMLPAASTRVGPVYAQADL